MAWFTDRHCFLLAVTFYGLSTIYSVFLWRKGFRRDDWVNYFLLVAGVALHTLAMTKRGLTLHSCPVNNLYEATTFLLWALGLASLVYSLLPKLKFLCAFTSPVLFTVGVFALMPSLDPPHGPKPEFSGALRSLHAATILQSYGAFGLAAVAAAMFLAQQHDLKMHKLRALLSFLPSIQRLELVTTRLVTAGFTLLTIGLIAGSQLPRKEGLSYFADAKVLWSALLWLVYLESLVAHKFFGRSARRFALSIIIAFVFLLLTFWLTNLLSPLHHDNSPQPGNGVATTIRHSSFVISPTWQPHLATRHPSLVTR
jgi:HemX protein